MSGEYNWNTLHTLVAVTDIPQYHIVQTSGDATAPQINGGLATADTQILVGVAQAEARTGDQVGVCWLGVTKLKAGGAITKGARLTSNSSGRAVAATSGDVVIGYTPTTVADNDIFTAFIDSAGGRM